MPQTQRLTVADILAGRLSQPRAVKRPVAERHEPTVRPVDRRSGRSTIDLEDGDLVAYSGLPGDLVDQAMTSGWLLALPRAEACKLHGHGLWWENRQTGLLNCVACWETPPPRSMVRRVWVGIDAGDYLSDGNRGELLLASKPGSGTWPWQVAAASDHPNAKEPNNEEW